MAPDPALHGRRTHPAALQERNGNTLILPSRRDKAKDIIRIEGLSVPRLLLPNMALDSGEQSVHAKISIDEQRPSADLEVHVRDLALRATATSPSPSAEVQWREVLYPQSGSALDPQSSTFDGRLWVKTFFDLYNSTLPAQPRSLGVAFRDLTVHGDTSGAQHQITAGNVFLGATEFVARRLGGVKQSKEVTILRDFEGILDAGQLLLVLGPPGAGCSTLLKTIAGETGGLRVSPETDWNYRGGQLSPLEPLQ